MKQDYEKMTVTAVGKVNTVVNKSGGWNDNSTQFQSKDEDQGGGNGGELP